jgi:hypothetical protein
MKRIGVEFNSVAFLHYAAQVHDQDPVAHVLDHGQIVSHKEIGEPHLLLEIAQQVHYLPLDRDIQGGDRFVKDDESRIQGDGPGDADALALASAEFMGIAVQMVAVKAHESGQFGKTVINLAAGEFRVNTQRFGNYSSHVILGLREL